MAMYTNGLMQQPAPGGGGYTNQLPQQMPPGGGGPMQGGGTMGAPMSPQQMAFLGNRSQQEFGMAPGNPGVVPPRMSGNPSAMAGSMPMQGSPMAPMPAGPMGGGQYSPMAPAGQPPMQRPMPAQYSPMAPAQQNFRPQQYSPMAPAQRPPLQFNGARGGMFGFGGR